MSTTPPNPQTEHDLELYPSLFISTDEDGDVKFSSNRPDLDVATALMMLEIAKTKLIAVHSITVHDAKKQKASRSILSVKPTILRP